MRRTIDPTPLDEDLRECVEQNMGIVYAVAIRSKSTMPIEDRVQAGTLGLMMAVQLYDPEHAMLSTFAWRHVISAIQKAERVDRPIITPHVGGPRKTDSKEIHDAALRASRVVGFVDELTMTESQFTDETEDREREEQREMIAAAVDSLPDRERRVVRDWLWEDVSLAEAGRRLGIGKARACQLKNQAIGRLRRMIKPPCERATSKGRSE